jgi:hypothetical protein
MSLRVYIGYDAREDAAAVTAARSLEKVTGGDIEPEFLATPKLYEQGLLWRPVDQRGSEDYDIASNEYTSTRFKNSRFLVPLLCQNEFALFVDCDVVFLRDPREMLDEVSRTHAVHVVKHHYHSGEQWKMVNQRQKWYARKNWSSVMLFNCEHAANRRLSLRDVNERAANRLHAFYWLNDMEIGTLDPAWNWLVDVQPEPKNVGIAHMTLGGPWLNGWRGGSFDERWVQAGEVSG